VARWAQPPLGQCDGVQRGIALEQLATASALAGPRDLGFLPGSFHSHDLHRGLPFYGPWPRLPAAAPGPGRTAVYSRIVKLAIRVWY
jgi:hypothetical protein